MVSLMVLLLWEQIQLIRATRERNRLSIGIMKWILVGTENFITMHFVTCNSISNFVFINYSNAGSV